MFLHVCVKLHVIWINNKKSTYKAEGPLNVYEKFEKQGSVTPQHLQPKSKKSAARRNKWIGSSRKILSFRSKKLHSLFLLLYAQSGKFSDGIWRLYFTELPLWKKLLTITCCNVGISGSEFLLKTKTLCKESFGQLRSFFLSCTRNPIENLTACGHDKFLMGSLRQTRRMTQKVIIIVAIVERKIPLVHAFVVDSGVKFICMVTATSNYCKIVFCRFFDP